MYKCACRASLRECEANEELCELVELKGADAGAAALLVECRGASRDGLQVRMLPRLRRAASFSCFALAQAWIR